MSNYNFANIYKDVLHSNISNRLSKINHLIQIHYPLHKYKSLLSTLRDRIDPGKQKKADLLEKSIYKILPRSIDFNAYYLLLLSEGVDSVINKINKDANDQRIIKNTERLVVMSFYPSSHVCRLLPWKGITPLEDFDLPSEYKEVLLS